MGQQKVKMHHIADLPSIYGLYMCERVGLHVSFVERDPFSFETPLKETQHTKVNLKQTKIYEICKNL